MGVACNAQEEQNKNNKINNKQIKNSSLHSMTNIDIIAVVMVLFLSLSFLWEKLK